MGLFNRKYFITLMAVGALVACRARSTKMSDVKAIGVADYGPADHPSSITLSVNGSCSGGVIDENVVLLAAHCVTGITTGRRIAMIGIPSYAAPASPSTAPSGILRSDDMQLAGSTNYVIPQPFPAITQIWVHPGYSSNPHLDLAIIAFDRALGFKKAPLWLGKLAEGTKIRIGGWGLESDEYTSSVTEDRREPKYFNTAVSEVLPLLFATPRYKQGSSTAEARLAKGDSGGPAFILKNNELYIVGVNALAQHPNQVQGWWSAMVRLDTPQVTSWLNQVNSALQSRSGRGFTMQR